MNPILENIAARDAHTAALRGDQPVGNTEAQVGIDDRAKRLYESCQSVKPEWDQLGDVTKSVWRDRVSAI